MRMYDILHKKRSGEALTAEEIAYFVRAYTAGDVPDYQAAAFCMAVCCRDMNDAETAALTDAMMRSGDISDLSSLGPCTVDKHSTGGVGDKTTPVVAPLVAALGGRVAKMSGRGLGHTGGTIDKLEAIPGYTAVLDKASFLRQVEDIGVAVIAQSGDLAPADKKLYALRDVTATVDSVPLIASSIMSKKLACGARSILLDVKVGDGAFMKTEADARRLADAMVRVGRACGRQVSAHLTAMARPLGMAIGNALEMEEAAAVLRGEGPADLRDICLILSAGMLELCHGWTEEYAIEQARRALDDGRALRRAEAWIAAQGGDPAFLASPGKLPAAPYAVPFRAPQGGYIDAILAERVGEAAMTLGAGREKKGDGIDPAAGIVLCAPVGAQVSRGDVLAVLHTSRADITAAVRLLTDAFRFSETPPPPAPLLLGRL